jgi:hypothetical protein
MYGKNGCFGEVKSQKRGLQKPDFLPKKMQGVNYQHVIKTRSKWWKSEAVCTCF